MNCLHMLRHQKLVFNKTQVDNKVTKRTQQV